MSQLLRKAMSGTRLADDGIKSHSLFARGGRVKGQTS